MSPIPQLPCGQVAKHLVSIPCFEEPPNHNKSNFRLNTGSADYHGDWHHYFCKRMSLRFIMTVAAWPADSNPSILPHGVEVSPNFINLSASEGGNGGGVTRTCGVEKSGLTENLVRYNSESSVRGSLSSRL